MKKPRVNSQTVKHIFETMEYGVIAEDTKAVKEWAKKQDNTICAFGSDSSNSIGTKMVVNDANSGEPLINIYVPKDDVKEDLVTRAYEFKAWRDSSYLQRTTSIKKFAEEIKQNSDFICKIESVTRGLLPADTRKYGVSFLVEYLQYFSNWSYLAENNERKPICICATDNTCLGVLGFALGPALARGCNILFYIEPMLSVSVTFLIELSVKAGIPEGTLMLLPQGNGTIWTPQLVLQGYLFGDIYKEEFKHLHFTQTVAVPNTKTPLIIFNDSDLDSACECAVSAIWEYGGLLPWSSDTILVQEDVYPEFVEKMKKRLHKIRVGSGTDRLADISYPIPSEIKKINTMIEDARAQGIDVYQPQTENKKFQPTLFIGMKVYNNNVINDSNNAAVAATILAFRTPKEAIALANNSKQGFAASVWCESIGLVSEVTRQLQVGTVWINSHGIVKPSVSFTTYKLDGAGYIGGSLGFYEFIDQEWRRLSKINSEESLNLLLNAKKEQFKWGNLPLNARIEILSKWASDLEQNKSTIIVQEGADKLIATICECIAKYSSPNASQIINNFDLAIKRESVGVVVFSRNLAPLNIPLLVGALLAGNAVVMVLSEKHERYRSFLKFLSSGLLIATGEFLGCIEDPRAIFIGEFARAYSGFQKNYVNLKSWKSILERCTSSKNIWTPIGDSI